MDLSAIRLAVPPPDVFFRHQAVHQAYGAVMKNLKPFSQFPDFDAAPFRKSFDRQHRLVLLRSQAGRVRGVLAETKELAQSVSELGQHDVVFFGNFFRRHKEYAPAYRQTRQIPTLHVSNPFDSNSTCPIHPILGLLKSPI
jgi:hypothetical protein